MKEKIEIKFNKLLLFTIAALSLATAALACADFFNLCNCLTYRATNKIYDTIAFIVFGIGGTLVLIKLFDRSPGVIITPKGIYNNTVIYKRFIPWSEILDIKFLHYRQFKFIVLKVKNPQKYPKTVGSPIYINTFFLKIDNQTLYNLIKKHIQKTEI